MSPKVTSIRLSNKRFLHIPKRSFVLRQRDFLKKLSKVAKDPLKVTKVLKQSKPSELKALAEITKNLLKKSYPSTGKRYLKKLLPFKGIIRKLANKNTTTNQKRNILLRQNNQAGGLPFLIPLLAPIITSLISAGIQAAV